MRVLIMLLLILSLTASACPKYRMVDTGDSVPCKGIFLNQVTNEAVKKDLRNNELRKKEIALKDLQLSTLKEDRDKWAREAHKQAKARHDRGNDLRNGFITGIALTLAIMFGVGQVSR